jgi:hypothetical protein
VPKAGTSHAIGVLHLKAVPAATIPELCKHLRVGHRIEVTSLNELARDRQKARVGEARAQVAIVEKDAYHESHASLVLPSDWPNHHCVRRCRCSWEAD